MTALNSSDSVVNCQGRGCRVQGLRTLACTWGHLRVWLGLESLWFFKAGVGVLRVILELAGVRGAHGFGVLGDVGQHSFCRCRLSLVVIQTWQLTTCPSRVQEGKMQVCLRMLLATCLEAVPSAKNAKWLWVKPKSLEFSLWRTESSRIFEGCIWNSELQAFNCFEVHASLQVILGNSRTNHDPKFGRKMMASRIGG